MKMCYENCIKKLESKGMFYIDLGLERIAKVLDALGNPQESLSCIHVAGTNGKGSVCAILESILREAGYKTGLYTSPHIFEYTERIKICGKEIPKEKFSEYFEKVWNKREQLSVHLTEFEMLTVIMFLYFKESYTDIVILETGMGGRFDATNVISKNICSVITRIDLDHTDRLGDTKEKIAFEKAGIIKKNCPVVTSMNYEEIKNRAKFLNSSLIYVKPKCEREFIDALSLKGIQQEENLALALAVIESFFENIEKKTVINGLKKVKHPYRFEYFKDKSLIIDASHNPNGIMALRKNLDFYFPDKSRRFVFGCLKTKDYESMMKILFKEDDEIFLNGFDYPNACTYEELKEKCPIPAKEYSKDIVLSEDKLNIICGSFYMLKEILK